MAQQANDTSKTTGKNQATTGNASDTGKTGMTPDQKRIHAENKRVSDELAKEKERAIARNATPLYAQMFTSKKHVAVWSIRGIEFIGKYRGMNMVYVGKLVTGLMHAPIKKGNKGHTTRGAIAPIAFWFDAESGKYGGFEGESSERLDYIASYVKGLMGKYLDGVKRIESGDYTVMGFSSLRNKDVFGQWLKDYMGIVTKDSTTLAQQNKVEADVNKAIDM